MTEINNVKSFFASIQVHLSDIWLESCISWCKAETLGSYYTPKELQTKVYEQWLLLDLRDVEVPILPPNLGSKQHFTLNGNFCLQMMHVVDISKPKLWQLQRIRNSNALTRGTQQDSDVVGTGKRMLQLRLTDGVQEVEAMEYRPVTSLSINVAPGTKIRIMGPVVIRRGRLMLEQSNVKLLGGEVDELLVSNAAENVLARALKLPENPNPGVIEEKMLVAEKDEKDEGYVGNFSIPKQPVAPEEDLMSEEIDVLMQAEAEYKQATMRQQKTPDMFEESPKKISMSLDDDDDDVFNDIDIDAHLDKVEKSLPAPNIMTIAKLLDMKKNVSKGVFKIRAKFKGVEEKLTITGGEYKLVIKIEDPTGELVVKIHSDLISDFAEYTPADIIMLKGNVLDKDESAIEKMVKAIGKVKDKLLVLDNVMSIQVEKDKVPVVTKILV